MHSFSTTSDSEAISWQTQARGAIVRKKLFFSVFLLFSGGPLRVGLRPSGKPELFHSNHSGHTGSIFLNGRSCARVAHWGHQKKKKKKKRERERGKEMQKWMRKSEYFEEIENTATLANRRPDIHYSRDTSIHNVRLPRSVTSVSPISRRRQPRILGDRSSKANQIFTSFRLDQRP